MKIVYKLVLTIALLLVLVLPVEVFADSNNNNTTSIFTPYSIYGLGELQAQGTLQTRSMGGAGLAVRSRASINLLNPAAYSMQMQRSIMFSVGAEGGLYTLSQSSSEGQTNRLYGTGNFRDIALQFPIAKGIGAALSLSPYSSVGYESAGGIVMSDYYVSTTNSGTGDITLTKFGVGWAITKGLSVGAAAQYYLGSIDRKFSTAFMNVAAGGSVNDMVGTENLSVSSIKGQFGIQWVALAGDRSALSVAATYDIGGDLKPRTIRTIDNESYDSNGLYAQNDTLTTSLIIPHQLSLGLAYSSDRWVLAADYTMQDWSKNSDVIGTTQNGLAVTYGTSNELRLGAEFTPRYGDIRKYINRVSYRAGARLGTSQYRFANETLGEYALTAGMGFPINMMGITKIEWGFEWGGVGSMGSINVDGEDIGLIRQNQFKFSLSFTMFGDDYWFQRMQID